MSRQKGLMPGVAGAGGCQEVAERWVVRHCPAQELIGPRRRKAAPLSQQGCGYNKGCSGDHNRRKFGCLQPQP